MVIGLTGYFCSGKSTVEKILAEHYNFEIIDLDKIGHQVLKDKTKEVVEAFGNIILDGEEINRKTLGGIVFKDKNKLNLLNSILHPAMVDDVADIISARPNANICISAAILFEMGLDELCDKIYVIKASFLQILKRAKDRNGYGLTKVMQIISKQKLRKYIKKSKKEIIIIKNNETKNKLEKTVSLYLNF